MGKRVNGEGTIFKLADGRWRVSLSMGTDAQGRRKRVSRTAARKADALALLEELKADRAKGIGSLAGSPRLSDYLDTWLGEVESRSSRNTVALYRNAVDKHIKPAIGGTKLDKITPVMVVSFVKGLREAGKGTRTQQICLAVLSQSLQEAAALGMIRINPALKVKRPADNPKEIDPFTPEEVKRIIEAATNDPFHHAAVVLLFTAGLRFGEMAGLPWKCVDLGAGTIRIEQQATTVAGKVAIGTPKTKRSRRTIELTPTGLLALQDHQKRMMALGRAGDDLVFRGSRGAMLSHKNWTSRVWNPLLKRAGVRQRPPHHARHTYATLSLAAGVPVHVVSAVLGHSKASVTLDTYAHYLPAHQQSATAAIAKLIG